MFRIAICDDEQVICSQIENIILSYAEDSNETIEVQVFYSGEELIKFLERGQEFDLLFLDIELKMLNGIEVGRKLREEMDNQIIQIIYISAKDSYYRELFEVRPMHFLHKPLNKADIIHDVRLAMKLSFKLGGIFTYRKAHEIHRKAVKNILYFESRNREVKMVTTEGEETFYAKIEEIYRQLAKYHFIFIHKSYVVNYFFITTFRYEEVVMSNMEILPISQSKRKATRELQMRYEREGVK